MSTQKTVAVTGASGYIASQLVKLLLEKGYKVHATVRDVNNAFKVQHLKDLPHAKENLVLFKADLTEPDSFGPAFAGTEVVFHTASPFFVNNITDGENQLLKPAIQGTENVLNSIANDPGKTIKTVVVTSSVAAIHFNPPKEPSHIYTESDWSDEEWLKSQNLFYQISKIRAEQTAWKWAESTGKQLGVRTIVINPSLVIGTLLQKELNTSAEIILHLLTGKYPEIPAGSLGHIDVVDVAEAHLKAYENPDASGRYMLIGEQIDWDDLVERLRKIRPEATALPTKVSTGLDFGGRKGMKYSSAKAEKLLGHPFRSIDDSLKATVESLEQNGFLKLQQ